MLESMRPKKKRVTAPFAGEFMARCHKPLLLLTESFSSLVDHMSNDFALLLVRADGTHERIKPRGVSCTQMCARVFGETTPVFTSPPVPAPFVLFIQTSPIHGKADSIIPGLVHEIVPGIYPASMLREKPAVLIGRSHELGADLDLMYVIQPAELERLERLIEKLRRDQMRTEAVAMLQRIYKTNVPVAYDEDSLDEPVGVFELIRAPVDEPGAIVTPLLPVEAEDDEQISSTGTHFMCIAFSLSVF